MLFLLDVVVIKEFEIFVFVQFLGEDNNGDIFYCWLQFVYLWLKIDMFVLLFEVVELLEGVLLGLLVIGVLIQGVYCSIVGILIEQVYDLLFLLGDVYVFLDDFDILFFK